MHDAYVYQELSITWSNCIQFNRRTVFGDQHFIVYGNCCWPNANEFAYLDRWVCELYLRYARNPWIDSLSVSRCKHLPLYLFALFFLSLPFCVWFFIPHFVFVQSFSSIHYWTMFLLLVCKFLYVSTLVLALIPSHSQTHTHTHAPEQISAHTNYLICLTARISKIPTIVFICPFSFFLWLSSVQFHLFHSFMCVHLPFTAFLSFLVLVVVALFIFLHFMLWLNMDLCIDACAEERITKRKTKLHPK